MEFRRVIMEIDSQADIIKFNNRLGFPIVGLIVPSIHFLALIDRIWPELPKKHSRLVNRGIVIGLIALFTAGFASTLWIKAQVENAGYVHCRKASGDSALIKTLAYSKNINICEEIVAADRQRTR